MEELKYKVIKSSLVSSVLLSGGPLNHWNLAGSLVPPTEHSRVMASPVVLEPEEVITTLYDTTQQQ